MSSFLYLTLGGVRWSAASEKVLCADLCGHCNGSPASDMAVFRLRDATRGHCHCPGTNQSSNARAPGESMQSDRLIVFLNDNNLCDTDAEPSSGPLGCVL